MGIVQDIDFKTLRRVHARNHDGSSETRFRSAGLRLLEASGTVPFSCVRLHEIVCIIGKVLRSQRAIAARAACGVDQGMSICS